MFLKPDSNEPDLYVSSNFNKYTIKCSNLIIVEISV